MRQLITLLLCMTCAWCHAQDNLDERGGIIGPFAIFDDPYTIFFYDDTYKQNVEHRVMGSQSKGLYTLDGKTLVKGNRGTYVFVKPGTTTIAEGAISRSKDFDKVELYIPHSVEYIAPGIMGCVSDIFVYDVAAPNKIKNEQSPQQGNAVETSRFNANGMRLEAPEHGLNIVRMSDNSSHKEVVK